MLFVNETEAREVLGDRFVHGYWTHSGYWAEAMPASGDGIVANKKKARKRNDGATEYIALTGYGRNKIYAGSNSTVYFETDAYLMTRKTAEGKARALTKATGMPWEVKRISSR